MEHDRVLTNSLIGGKVVRLITDNASNYLPAFGDTIIPGFESYFISNDDTDDGKVQNSFDKQEELLQLPCFIHTSQLVVKDGLKESECIRSLLGKVVEIAKLSHKFITMAEKLKKWKFKHSRICYNSLEFAISYGFNSS